MGILLHLAEGESEGRLSGSAPKIDIPSVRPAGPFCRLLRFGHCVSSIIRM